MKTRGKSFRMKTFIRKDFCCLFISNKFTTFAFVVKNKRMSKIVKRKNEIQLTDTDTENILFSNVAQIIEKRKFNVISVANN